MHHYIITRTWIKCQNCPLCVTENRTPQLQAESFEIESSVKLLRQIVKPQLLTLQTCRDRSWGRISIFLYPVTPWFVREYLKWNHSSTSNFSVWVPRMDFSTALGPYPLDCRMLWFVTILPFFQELTMRFNCHFWLINSILVSYILTFHSLYSLRINMY